MSLLVNPKCGTWVSFIREHFEKRAPFQDLISDLYSNAPMVPAPEDLFRAFELCPLGHIKVFVLGQDPYPTPGDADGLAFSTRGSKLPPSLKNIFKELESDLKIKKTSGDLTGWAKEGVFLLNSALTTIQGEVGAHKDLGWGSFIDHVVDQVSFKVPNAVFVLWGKDAQKREHLIDHVRHLVLKSAHPSPLSASRGFFGSKPFSKANEFLTFKNRTAIDWSK